MVDTATQTRIWRDRTGGDAEPTLAIAPEGLSARRVERWLDLPEGAWQRRRLYALRVTGKSYESLGFRPGDLVIVEPGARQQHGAIVVTRSHAGMALKRIAAPMAPPRSSRGRRIPTVLELPLRERAVENSEHVVGSVIGKLRETGTGALRPVAMQARRPRHSENDASAPPTLGASHHDLTPGMIEGACRRWQEWLRAMRGQDSATSESLERWERLDGTLVALCECLSRTHNAELRTALQDELATVIATIHNEMRRYTNYPLLQ